MNIKFALDAVYSRTVIDYQLQKIIIFYFFQLGSFYWGLSCENEWVLSSVTRLGDLLDFGQLFKGFGIN